MTETDFALANDAARSIAVAIQMTPDVGRIWVRDSMRYETTYVRMRAVVLGSSYSPYFVDDAGEECYETLDKVRMYVADQFPKAPAEWLPTLEPVAAANETFLVVGIGTPDIPDDIIRVLVLNKLRGTLKSAAVKARHETNLSALTGLKDLPRADRAWIRHDATVVFPQAGSVLEEFTSDIVVIDVGGETVEEIGKRKRALAKALRDLSPRR